jgi:hypothetical protein
VTVRVPLGVPGALGVTVTLTWQLAFGAKLPVHPLVEIA